MPSLFRYVAFPSPLPVTRRALLERCGLFVVEFDTPAFALRTLRTCFKVDAVIIESHNPIVNAQPAAVFELFEFASAAPWNGVPLPVLLLTSSKLPSEMGRKASGLGVQLVTATHQNYREIGRLVWHLCGSIEK